MKAKLRTQSTGRVFNVVLVLLIILFVVAPLYIIGAALAIRSGLFSFNREPLPPGATGAVWGFIGTGVTASATLVALLVTYNQNRRSEYRLTLDTAVRGIALTQNADGTYGNNAAVAGSLATLVHLGHPLVAMRMLAAAWDDKAVDKGSAVWLINEVLLKGTPDSQLEAATIFYAHAADLCTDDESHMYYVPVTLEQGWLPLLSFDARTFLILGLVRLLITKDKSWWNFGHRWESPTFYAIIETDPDPVIRGFAAQILRILLSDVEGDQWNYGFSLGGKTVYYYQIREALDKVKDVGTATFTDPNSSLLLTKLEEWMTDKH